MAARKPQRGGARPGAGRKPRDESGACRKYTIRLAPAESEHCERLAGTVNAAVRQLVRRDMEVGR